MQVVVDNFRVADAGAGGNASAFRAFIILAGTAIGLFGGIGLLYGPVWLRAILGRTWISFVARRCWW